MTTDDDIAAVLSASLRKPLVLLLDDDPGFCSTMRRLLGDRSQLVVAYSVADAMHAIEKLGSRIDLALLDVGLPDGSGLRVCEKIRSIPGGQLVEIGVISGMDDEDLREQASAAGSDWFSGNVEAFQVVKKHFVYTLVKGYSMGEDKSK